MSNNDNINHDQLKTILAQLQDEIEVPEPSNWDRVHAEIIKQNKRRKRVKSLKQICSVAAAAILISVFINGNYTNVSAKFTSFFKVIKDEVTYIFLGSPQSGQSNQGAVTKSPNEGNFSNIEGFLNKELEENLLKLNFNPVLPGYIPEDFELQQSVVRTQANNYKFSSLSLIFNNENNFIYIDYRNLDGIEIVSSEINTNFILIEEFRLNGSHAIYLESNTGEKGIEWITKDNIKLSLISRIDKQELIEVAKSIK